MGENQYSVNLWPLDPRQTKAQAGALGKSSQMWNSREAIVKLAWAQPASLGQTAIHRNKPWRDTAIKYEQNGTFFVSILNC